MSDMEHMDMRWKPEYNDGGESWNIVTDMGREAWYVCAIAFLLPGDPSGELTCRAICDAHNAALNSKQSAAPQFLTKREEFAKAAMQGLIVGVNQPDENVIARLAVEQADALYENVIARLAVEQADALLAELENGGVQ